MQLVSSDYESINILQRSKATHTYISLKYSYKSVILFDNYSINLSIWAKLVTNCTIEKTSQLSFFLKKFLISECPFDHVGSSKEIPFKIGKWDLFTTYSIFISECPYYF